MGNESTYAAIFSFVRIIFITMTIIINVVLLSFIDKLTLKKDQLIHVQLLLSHG